MDRAAETLGSVLDERVAAGDFPGAVVCAAGDEGHMLVGSGNAVLVPDCVPLDTHTIYDLASLTKVLSTTMLVAQAIEAGDLELDDPVGDHLEEFDRADRAGVTLGHLLTHTSGLPKWRPLYADPGDPERVAAYLGALPLEYEPGTRVIYSDPGFIALGLVLERLEGAPLADLFAERIAEPLGLERTMFLPPESLRGEIAAAETGNVYEREMCGSACDGYTGWRDEVIWGEVHDGNAHFLGGAAGHAGLFGTAAEVTLLARQFLAGSRLLRREETLDLFRKNLTPWLEEDRSVGFQLASTDDSAAGPGFPPYAFGHLGFTGTSVWIDPDMRRVVTFLTNRTHPVRRDLPFNELRRRVNALAIDALG